MQARDPFLLRAAKDLANNDGSASKKYHVEWHWLDPKPFEGYPSPAQILAHELAYLLRSDQEIKKRITNLRRGVSKAFGYHVDESLDALWIAANKRIVMGYLRYGKLMDNPYTPEELHKKARVCLGMFSTSRNLEDIVDAFNYKRIELMKTYGKCTHQGTTAQSVAEFFCRKLSMGHKLVGQDRPE